VAINVNPYLIIGKVFSSIFTFFGSHIYFFFNLIFDHETLVVFAALFMRMKKKSVFIVGDQAMIRQGLALILENEFKCTGESPLTASAIKKIISAPPQVVLFDICLTQQNIFKVIDFFVKSSNHSRLIAFCDDIPDTYIRSIREAGAAGILKKDISLDELCNAIHAIGDGGSILSPAMMCEAPSALKDPECGMDISKLSSRELQIADCISKGMSSREIGSQLCISSKTVDVHRYNIHQKLKIKKTNSLVNYFRRPSGRKPSPCGDPL
jgi:DNA-binding NarL/FixJ family response regulator